jgi:TRAP-type C4-dicarboxylate transport system permease small subunit
MEKIAELITSLLALYYRLLKILLTALMALMIVPVSLQILSRYTGIVPRYIWTEEIARFCFVWIVMIGSMIAVRDGTHFKVDLLPPPKTPRQKGVFDLIVHISMILMALVFAWYGYDFAAFGSIQESEMSGINMLSIYISFPLAGLTWALFLVERIVADMRLILGKTPRLQAS